MAKLTTKFYALLKSWGGASFEIHSAYTTIVEAEEELRAIKCDLLGVPTQIDNDTLDSMWDDRAYNGCDQEEYELVFWEPKESE
jgi:hypothetical protein